MERIDTSFKILDARHVYIILFLGLRSARPFCIHFAIETIFYSYLCTFDALEVLEKLELVVSPLQHRERP